MRDIHAELIQISDEEAIALTERYGAHNYHPLPVNIVAAKGIYAYDGHGKEYIDCVGSYSAVANGHLSEYVTEAAKRQLDKLTLTSRAVYTSELALFLKELCEYTESDMACPMNTGAEAVETALKLARKWAYTVKGVPDNKAEIICVEDNFHGRTITIVGFSTEEQYKRHFGPFPAGFKVVPFGSVKAIEEAITPNTAAILAEPVQAEGGILFPPDGYMESLRQLCDRENVLLIWDEIQTGFCRTGKRFAWQHESAKPDLMCLGKALGGGVLPVAAVVGRKEVLDVFQPGDHGSTFGGNPLGAVVAMAAMEEMKAKSLDERSAAMGARLLEGIRELGYACVEELRGRGLLVGLEVKEGTDTKKLGAAFLDAGILTKETRSRTFRFAPPLIVSEDEVDSIVRRVGLALGQVSTRATATVAG
jgi:ornithine--oxo-acid transaminase